MVLVSNSESKTIFFIAFVLVFKSQVRQDNEAILLVLESVSKVLFLSDLRTKNIWYWTPTLNLWSWPYWTQTRLRPRLQILQSEFKSMYSRSMHGPTRPRHLTWTQGPRPYFGVRLQSILTHLDLDTLVLFDILENSECVIYTYSIKLIEGLSQKGTVVKWSEP